MSSSSSSSSSITDAPSTTALWNGTVISTISKVTFSGSSSPVVSGLARCIGKLVRPSGDASRTLVLQCRYNFSNLTKATVELTQYNLGVFMSKTPNGTLLVHGNTYTNLTVKSISFEEIIHNEYMKYTIEFELSPYSRALQSDILVTDSGNGARSATFNYTYGDINQSLSSYEFLFLHNVDLTVNTSFDTQESERAVRSEGGYKRISGGLSEMKLTGWVVDTSVKNIDSYFYNINCSVGPLGKKGTLVLGGNTYENVLMTGCGTVETTGGDSNGYDGSSAFYNIDFVKGVC